MYGAALPLLRWLLTKPEWMVWYKYKRLTSFHHIPDLFKIQWLLQDFVEYFLYGYVMTYSKLDLIVDPYEPVYRNTSQSEQANSDITMEKNNNASTLIVPK